MTYRWSTCPPKSPKNINKTWSKDSRWWILDPTLVALDTASRQVLKNWVSKLGCLTSTSSGDGSCVVYEVYVYYIYYHTFSLWPLFWRLSATPSKFRFKIQMFPQRHRNWRQSQIRVFTLAENVSEDQRNRLCSDSFCFFFIWFLNIMSHDLITVNICQHDVLTPRTDLLFCSFSKAGW